MRSLFQITFKRKIKEINKDTILDTFLINLQGTHYSNLERIGKYSLIVEGDFWYIQFPHSYNRIFDIFNGFAKRVDVSITNDNEIHYKLDFTYGAIWTVVSWIFLAIIIFIIPDKIDNILFFSALGITVLSNGYRFLSHLQIFNFTIKHGSKFKGKYNWDKIMKAKSLNELREIANGNTALTFEVRELARREILRREENQNVKT
jgi:hypothetical protein